MGKGGGSEPARRLVRLLERNPFLRVLERVATLVGAVVLIGSTCVAAKAVYDRFFEWDDRAEEQIESLRADVLIANFDKILGDPQIRRVGQSGTAQRIYQGRGFWVQAVTDPGDSVMWFAVTVCDPKVQPAWRLWAGNEEASIALNGRRLFEVGPAPTGYQWRIPAATANGFVYAMYYGGNPSNYQSWVWGYNDACADGALEALEDLPGIELWESPSADLDSVHAAEPLFVQTLPVPLRAPFARVPVNTVALFGVHRFMGPMESEALPFQIGADRILTRTLQEPSLAGRTGR